MTLHDHTMPRKVRYSERHAATIGEARDALFEAAPCKTQFPMVDDPTHALSRARIFDFPMELWAEALSYLKYIPVPLTCTAMHTLFPPEYGRHSSKYAVTAPFLEQTDTLRALSQTCRRFRNIFLPLLWRQLNTCALRKTSGSWSQTFAEAIIRKSIFVERNPALGRYVQTMSLSLSLYAAGNVFPELIRTLHSLPNLHTLQILRMTKLKSMRGALRAAFDGHVFPNIKTLGLPIYGQHILKCCPSATTIYNYHYECTALIGVIAKCCSKLEEFHGFNGNERALNQLVKAAPNLRLIDIKGRHISADIIQTLSGLKHLCTIKLKTAQPCDFGPPMPADALDDEHNALVIKAAKSVVKKSLGDGKRAKTVVLEQEAGWFDIEDGIRSWSRVFNVERGWDTWSFNEDYHWMITK